MQKQRDTQSLQQMGRWRREDASFTRNVVVFTTLEKFPTCFFYLLWCKLGVFLAKNECELHKGKSSGSKKWRHMSEMLQKLAVLILQHISSVGGVRRVACLNAKTAPSTWAKLCCSLPPLERIQNSALRGGCWLCGTAVCPQKSWAKVGENKYT